MREIRVYGGKGMAINLDSGISRHLPKKRKEIVGEE